MPGRSATRTRTVMTPESIRTPRANSGASCKHAFDVGRQVERQCHQIQQLVMSIGVQRARPFTVRKKGRDRADSALRRRTE